MIKTTILIIATFLLVIPLVACPFADNNEKGDNPSSSANVNASNIAGSYEYEQYEGELPYNITFHRFKLNDDKTYSEEYEWTSKSNSQKTSGGGEGTWAFSEGNVILTNKSNYETILEYSDDKLIQTVKIGYSGDEKATVYFRKE